MTRCRPFQKGKSGNLAGRPRGSRNALFEDLFTVLAADFAEHGAHVIEAVRTTSPLTYLRNCAAIAAKATDAQSAIAEPIVIRWANPIAADL